MLDSKKNRIMQVLAYCEVYGIQPTNAMLGLPDGEFSPELQAAREARDGPPVPLEPGEKREPDWITEKVEEVHSKPSRYRVVSTNRLLAMISLMKIGTTFETRNRLEKLPPGVIRCFGQTLSRHTYEALFREIGDQQNGVGFTFQVPDCRPRFVYIKSL